MFFYVFLNIFYIDMLKVSQQNNTKNIIVIFEKKKNYHPIVFPSDTLMSFLSFFFLWLQFFYVK